MDLERELRRFDAAAGILPVRLRRAAACLPETQRAAAEEFRLRLGREASVLVEEEEIRLPVRVEEEDLEGLCNLATEFSRYAAAETLRHGYLPVRGGCRVGFCGTAVLRGGAASDLRDFSSAAVRIAREKPGIAEGIAPQLVRDGRFCSTLLLSPPGGGKTTLLRDLIRCLSGGVALERPWRVGLADERGEVAVMYRGQAQMDVGPRTDVQDGCPKALAIPMLLRCMNPQIIAADEITAREDLDAMAQAAGCGVGLLATVHAAAVEELRQKPLYARLLDEHVFSRAVVIAREGKERRFQVEELC